MATRSIITYQPDVECDVCGRRLLRGERPDVFIGAGRKHTVCELCVPRATGEGWLRESEAEALSLQEGRSRGARSLLGRLRQMRGPGLERDRGREDHLGGGRRTAFRGRKRDAFDGREHDAYDDAYQGSHGDATYQEDVYGEELGAQHAAAQAPSKEDDRTLEHVAQGGSLAQSAPPAAGSFPLQGSPQPPAAGAASLEANAVPPAAHLAPPPADQLPHFAGDQETAAHPGLPQRARRALAVFNSSRFAERIAGIARSLGEPEVTVRPANGREDVLAVVVAWELCWYRYEIDLSDEASVPQLVAEGMELHELPAEDRACNAAADERGELSLLR